MQTITYFLICCLIIILFFACLKILFRGSSPKKVIRGIDKTLSRSQLGQIFVLLFFIAFIFVFIFFFNTAITSLFNGKQSLSFWDAIGHFLEPGNFEGDSSVNWWILILNICGMTLMAGLLISVLTNLLERRVDNLKTGNIYYKFENHYVIIGYNKMTISLIKQIAKEGSEKGKKKDIILQTIQDVPSVRHELFSYINKDMENRVIIMSGNRNSREDLEKLSLQKAEKLFIIGEINEYDHDSLNIECLKTINNILKEKHKKILFEKTIETKQLEILLDEEKILDKPCYIYFENQSTYAILQQQDIAGLTVNIKETREVEEEKREVKLLNFMPFNFQELWAQKLFVENKYDCREVENGFINYLPLDRGGINYNSEMTVHLVILGMSKMGIALGIQACHLCHFPNFIRDKKLKTKITFIDENADREMYFLRGRHPHFFQEIDYHFQDILSKESFNNLEEPNTKGNKEKFTDIELHFVKGRFEHPEIQSMLSSFANEQANTFLTIAVCLNSPPVAIATGLYLPDNVYNSNTQILIKQDTTHSILSLLNTANGYRYRNVKAFGMSDNCLDLSKANDDIPIIIKYIYDYYYSNKKQPTIIPPIEKLKIEWKSLATVKKWSNRYNADTIFTKQRSFNVQPGEKITEDDLKLLAIVEHNRWNIEELLLGYRPTTIQENSEIGTDPDKKNDMKKKFIHNDICPYDNIQIIDAQAHENGNIITDPREYDICISEALPMMLKYYYNNKQAHSNE